MTSEGAALPGVMDRRRLLGVIGGSVAAAGLSAVVGVGAAEAASSTIVVDAASRRGRPFNPGWYVNHVHPNWHFSRGLLPEGTVRQLRDDFRVKWARVFIQPHRYYDPATGVYDLARNHPYVDQAASYADRLHLCFSSPELEKTPALWEEIIRTTLLDLKRRHPKIGSVVPWNEPNNENSGPMTPQQFYPYYAAGYRAVNTVNQQLAPEEPILVGGPGAGIATAGSVEDFVDDFLRLHVEDADPAKKLDFVTYQCYGYRNNPQRAQGEKEAVRTMLRRHGLNADLPVYVTEFGLYGGSGTGHDNGDGDPQQDLEHDQLVQAAGMAATSWYFMLGGMNRPFQWVVHHGQNRRKDMFVEGLDGVRLPYGHVVAMLAKFKPSLDGELVQTRISPAPASGIGMGAMTHVDSNRLSAMYWNYQSENGTDTYTPTITLNNLPESLYPSGRALLERWVVDATHNNYDHDGTTTFSRVVAKEVDVSSGRYSFQTSLKKNAVGLALLTPA